MQPAKLVTASVMSPIRTLLQASRAALAAGLLLAAGSLTAPRAQAQQQYQGVCAQAKMEILQELTFERTGFEATLEITNNLGGDPITDFSAELTFADPAVLENGVPKDVSDRFFVQRPRLTTINAVDGTGIIGPTQTAIIRWFIIPKAAAGGTNPLGTRYEVGVRMAGKVSGTILPKSVLLAIPDTIVVRPEPQLNINYFQPRDVQGDDPFTEDVESPIPFTLGVLVNNSGFGTARNLKIASQQPKIVENKAGLLLVARLLGSRVQDSPLDESSLTVNLGDIGPGATRKGAWDMITSLSGEFVEFKASYTHRDDLGGEATSLIKSLAAHFIAHEGINDDPGRDAIKDFIADVDRDENILPDTLYESQGQILPINHAPDSSVTTPLSGSTFGITVNAVAEGWGYVRLSDPGQAKLAYASAVRNDGRVVNLANLWSNIRYEKGTNAKLTYLNLFDKYPSPGTYTYTITYAPPTLDVVAPVTRLRFSGEVTESGGRFYITRDTQMYFTSEDASPVSIVYSTDGGPDVPGLPFRITTPGQYQIAYHATDSQGNIEAPKTAILVLSGSGPSIASLTASGADIAVTDDILTFRPDGVTFAVNLGASAVDLTTTFDIFRGIRSWPTISGVPVSPTTATTATLTVAGEHTDFYRYRVNGGAWSTERPVATPFALSGLSGEVTVQVLARSQYATFPADNQALTATWTVDAGAADWTVSGLPATPTRSQLPPLTVSGPGLELYRWRPGGSYYRAEAPPATPIDFPTQSTGSQLLELIGRRAGVWQEEASPSRWSWTYDPAYGSDFSSLPLVRTHTVSTVGGASVTYRWDGRSADGTPQAPGWYTVRIRTVDTLGNFAFRNTLVRIQDVTGTPTTIAGLAAGPERSDAQGDWLVWQERGSGAPNIRAKRVSQVGSPTLEITSTSLAQSNPRTDGRYVVWQGQQVDGTWDIYLTDLTNPAVNQNITNTADTNEVNPALEWPWVVWQARDATDATAAWQVYAFNLFTAQLVQANPSSQDQLDPDVQGGRVVWQDFREVGFGEIYLRNLETGEQRRLTNSSYGQYKPAIDGNWVVWQDNRNTEVDIYGFDFLRGVERRLTNTVYNESEPKLHDTWLLHAEDSLGVLTGNFRLVDLATLRSVPLTASASTKSFGALSGHELFWQQGTSGSSSLEGASIPGLQPVFRNFNAVALTTDLVTRYPTSHALLAAWNTAANVQAVSKFTSLSPLAQQTSTIAGGVASGPDFPLVAGEFLWVQFPSSEVVDLGFALADTVDIPAGLSAFSYARFPLDYTGHRLVTSLGLSNVSSLRVLDARSGQWRVLQVDAGSIVGPDFPIPGVAVVIVQMTAPVSAWKP